MLTFLKSLVIPLLEGCSQLWYPWKAKDIQAEPPCERLSVSQRCRERYIIIYIWKITQHMVPNIDGTMGHKIKTRKPSRHGTQCVIQNQTNRNPAQSLQENAITVFGPRLHNSLLKYLREIESVKTEKFKFSLDKFLELIPDEPKMPNYVTKIRMQQHLRPAHSSEGSRNLPKRWSPRLGHGAILAASKPLQVSKYEWVW